MPHNTAVAGDSQTGVPVRPGLNFLNRSVRAFTSEHWMARRRKNGKLKRRDFLKKVTAGGALLGGLPVKGESGMESRGPKNGVRATESENPSIAKSVNPRIIYPRVFAGRNLRMIAFPLGGIGTGTIALGGRGQLRDWEIFNRPDKGNVPDYCFPAIWAKAEGKKPVARVLEARIQPPYEGSSGLGSGNAPGLPRLDGAEFTGAYPFARIQFQDARLPVAVRLEAFNPLVPLDADASGLPVAILRYDVRNPDSSPVNVALAFSLENPVGKEGRQASFRNDEGLAGLYMENPFLPAADPLRGSVVLGVLGAPAESVSYLRGWKRAQWWDGPLTFWDDFTADGVLSSDAPPKSPVGSIAVTQSVAAGREISVTFLIAWHFPNRTPERCGWEAPEGEQKTVVGNYYCQRFSNAWEVARHLSRELPTLEGRTRKFAATVEGSTLPAAALDAALSNLSTLRTNTAFRTADGEFHGFEGCNDRSGCCHGTCTHVWNYEQATAFVFPSLSRSIRESELLRNTREDGLMGFRSYLPDGKKIWDRAAADGQMGCIMKLYRDWQLSGDTEWLKRLWPQAKRALEFAWIKGGWDENRDGVAEGVQHNTYDVEFYGPNPLCGVWYLGALRAGEEMALAMGDDASARQYRRLFESGSKWIDGHLFNGEYYIQKVEGRSKEEVANGLMIGMGAADPQSPDYQMGEACLADQLLGQYMAHVTGLGYLLDDERVGKTLKSIYRYNYRASLAGHECVQRTYALNEEGGLLVATYPSGKRPEIPFPYFGEVWTGLEYQFAAHLVFEGMTDEALTVVESARDRHDGERRNPWNEPECGHHYARPMASWALLIALTGFHYSGVERRLTLAPRVRAQNFRSFWTIPSGWGRFSQTIGPANHRVEVQAEEGSMTLASLALAGNGKAVRKKVSAQLGSETISATLSEEGKYRVIAFERELEITPAMALTVGLS
jgi:non-lysosomal glucosylceramidase